MIGSTPYLPKEIYCIPVTICLRHLTGIDCMSTSSMSDVGNQNCESGENESLDDGNNSGCGEHCGSLSHRLTFILNRNKK